MLFVYKVYGNLHVKLFYIKKILFYLLLEIDISHVSDFRWVLLPFEIFIEFGLPLRPRETDWRSGPGCWWSSSRSMKIGHWWFEGCVEFVLKNFAIYWSCRWRLGGLDLSPNWFEIVFQAFDFSSQKNRLVMIEWNCQFS